MGFNSLLAALFALFFPHLTPTLLFLQTLYTHIVTDIKNINAKHKNNKINTVSTLVFLWHCVSMIVLDLTVVRSSDVTELHVHHAEGQQPYRCKDFSRCDDGALQEEHLVSCKTYHWIPPTPLSSHWLLVVCLRHRNDAKTVNVITTACFSKVTKVRFLF